MPLVRIRDFSGLSELIVFCDIEVHKFTNCSLLDSLSLRPALQCVGIRGISSLQWKALPFHSNSNFSHEWAVTCEKMRHRCRARAPPHNEPLFGSRIIRPPEQPSLLDDPVYLGQLPLATAAQSYHNQGKLGLILIRWRCGIRHMFMLLVLARVTEFKPHVQSHVLTCIFRPLQYLPSPWSRASNSQPCK